MTPESPRARNLPRTPKSHRTHLAELYARSLQNSTFARNLGRLRRDAGITLPKLAARLRVPCHRLHDVELGIRPPDLNEAYALAKFFGVSMDRLMGLAPEGGPSWLVEMLGLVEELSPEDRGSVRTLLKGIVDGRGGDGRENGGDPGGGGRPEGR